MSRHAASQAPTRRRRSREQTRLLLLSAAAQVAVTRVSGKDEGGHNPLAGVRITDALAAVNQGAAERQDTPMTTGAAYHIWADQAAFQEDLLTYVMNRISVPGAQQIEERAEAMMSKGLPADDIFRMISDAGFEASREAPELFLGVGLGVLASPELVRSAQRHANAVYVETVERIYRALLPYAGRRLRPGQALVDLIWATEALAWGYLLRWRTHPEIAGRVDTDGNSTRSSAYLGIVHAFTEPEQWRPAD